MRDQFQFKQTRPLIVLGLLVPCVLTVIPAFFAYRAEHQLADSFNWVSHTIQVKRELKELLLLLVDAETNQRGFLLTGHDAYLKPCQAAVAQAPRQLDAIRRLTKDNAVQQTGLNQLAPIVATRLRMIEKTVALQQDGKHDEAVLLVGTDRGKRTMDDIRARVELMETEESRLLVTREQVLDSHSRFSAGFLVTLVAVNVLFATAVFIMIRRLSRVQGLIRMCAWSRTVEYQGEWISFEEYLLRRFNLNTSHGISPAEAEKAFESIAVKKLVPAGVEDRSI